MWVKVDDRFPEHHKVMHAGSQLGPSGPGRVIAIWLPCTCYANRVLSDGLIPEQVIKGWTVYDRRPLDVAYAMAQRLPNGDAGLLEAVSGGYRLHDYTDYQPAAADVKAKRAADKERKRLAKLKKEAEERARLEARGFLLDSARNPERNPDGIRDDSAGIPGRSRARDPDPTRDPRKKEQCGDGRTTRDDGPSVPVLTKLVHSIVEEEPGRPWTLDELTEEVKTRAARAHLAYDGTSVRKAMDSAAFQRSGHDPEVSRWAPTKAAV